MKREHAAIVAAVALNGVVGLNGGLPWHLPKDLKRFKERTMGKAVIMGRWTWEGLPKKPLPGRLNIIVSRTMPQSAPNPEEGNLIAVVRTLKKATAMARKHGYYPMIIGGPKLWKEAIGMVDTIYLTNVHLEPDGDAFFPALDPKKWSLRESLHEQDGETDLTHTTLKRIDGWLHKQV